MNGSTILNRCKYLLGTMYCWKVTLSDSNVSTVPMEEGAASFVGNQLETAWYVHRPIF